MTPTRPNWKHVERVLLALATWKAQKSTPKVQHVTTRPQAAK